MFRRATDAPPAAGPAWRSSECSLRRSSPNRLSRSRTFRPPRTCQRQRYIPGNNDIFNVKKNMYLISNGELLTLSPLFSVYLLVTMDTLQIKLY